MVRDRPGHPERPSRPPPGDYIIQGHNDLAGHYPKATPAAIAEVYPDGVGYELWPPDVTPEIGNRHLAVFFVSRASFDAPGYPAACTRRIVPAEGDRMALLSADGEVAGYWTVTEFLTGSSDSTGHARATVIIEFDEEGD